MDNQITSHPLLTMLYTASSVLLGITASIVTDIELYVRIGAGLAAVAAGYMACRAHYFTIKEKKHSIKNQNRTL